MYIDYVRWETPVATNITVNANLGMLCLYAVFLGSLLHTCVYKNGSVEFQEV